MSALHAIVTAPSFWHQTVTFAASALTCFAALLGLAIRLARRRGGRLQEILSEERGAAEAIDFVLTFPMMLGIMFMFVQFALAANASLIVHYAAYAAARSARAYYWERPPGFIKQYIQANRGNAFLHLGSWIGIDELMIVNQGTACERASDAARLVLAAAAPSGIASQGPGWSFTLPGTQGCRGSFAWASVPILVTLVSELVPNAVTNTLTDKFTYAFSPDNTIVDVAPPDLNALGQLVAENPDYRIDSMPIVATVSFRYTPVLPYPAIPPLFQRGPDGRWSYWMTAQVELL